jgi:hypothetical protein
MSRIGSPPTMIHGEDVRMEKGWKNVRRVLLILVLALEDIL